jgi:dTMP kinase
VNAGFQRIAEEDPQRVRVVESAQAKSQTSRLIFEELADLFPWMREIIDEQPEYFAPLDARKVHKQ